MKFSKKLIAILALNTHVWIFLRKILELNFYGQKKIIRKHFACSSNDRILDFGCGTGDFSVCFPAESYIGIDISEKNIRLASKRYAKRFVLADGKQLPFPESFFSKVFIVGVLHHLSSDECRAALAEIGRVLKPDGKLLIMEDTKTGFLPIQIVQYFDQGDFIRPVEEWRKLFVSQFQCEREWVFKNGLCFYSAFLLNSKKTQ